MAEISPHRHTSGRAWGSTGTRSPGFRSPCTLDSSWPDWPLDCDTRPGWGRSPRDTSRCHGHRYSGCRGHGRHRTSSQSGTACPGTYSPLQNERTKEMFYLTTHSTHFILRLYGVGHMVKAHSDSKRRERGEREKCFI